MSLDQGGIVAFLVGVIAERSSANIVTIPVSKFNKFNEDVAAGKYKWHKPDEEGTDLVASKSASKSMVERIWQRIHVQGIVYNLGPTVAE
jgi:hypothetical protein